jgi:hypothetical protein
MQYKFLVQPTFSGNIFAQYWQNISIKKAKEAAGPQSLFHLPISSIAYQQLLELTHSLNSLPETAETGSRSVLYLVVSSLLRCQST